MNAPIIPDPIHAGLARGWKVVDAARLDADRTMDADVVIVGSGAGGGVTAEFLALAGLKVIIVEEGALRSSSSFKMREADAYPALYQESAARKTRDKAINILQGRTVGGSTTINWTSSFRTPAADRHRDAVGRRAARRRARLPAGLAHQPVRFAADRLRRLA